jgi:hypothetical protein
MKPPVSRDEGDSAMPALKPSTEADCSFYHEEELRTAF